LKITRIARRHAASCRCGGGTSRGARIFCITGAAAGNHCARMAQERRERERSAVNMLSLVELIAASPIE
jgi:hypothetical protein